MTLAGREEGVISTRDAELCAAISHQIAVEDAVYTGELELEAKNEELDSFVYSVSHDLKPSVAADGMACALFEDDAERLDEQGRHLIVADSGQRIHTRTIKMLVHNRGSTGARRSSV